MAAQAQHRQETGLYPIGTVTEITGVPAVTLRAWERRHGLIEPVRKASGHRLYTQAHIDLITRIVALLERGIRIGQVRGHPQLTAALGEAGGTSGVWQRYAERIVGAIGRFDEDALEAAYGEALGVYPVHVVTEQLLTPVLRELGRRWADGESSVAEEHFFGCYLRNKLGARFHHRNRQGHGPKLLLAGLPSERHETGLLLFALAASDAGYRPILLGADLPLGELPAAARKTAAAAVVLSGLMRPETREIAGSLAAVVGELRCPVFVGGRASVEACEVFKRAGAEPLGLDIGNALVRIGSVLHAA